MNKKINDLEQKLYRGVDINDIINEYGYNSDNGDLFKNLDELSNFNILSLDKQLNDNDGVSTTLGDLIVDESNKSTDYLVNNVNIKSDIEKCLNILNPRDKQIIIGLYGLDGSIPRSLKDIGKELIPNISQETVRQIKVKALKRLKNSLSKYNINSLIF